MTLQMVDWGPTEHSCRELISLIENNSVVVIRGATGSGKTTQLPQFILDHYSQKNAMCNIAVTQPRKIGASSIARWIATERKVTLGSLVGYQVGLEKIASEHTRLIYMTTGVLLQKLVMSKTLTDYTHIFIDEVHERTDVMDFLLLVIRKLLRSNSRYVKVILMSATISCREFAEYFSTSVHGHVNPAYVFEVDGSPFAIEQYYLDDLRCLVPGRTAQNVSLNPPERGSVLVFLPGLMEISRMQEALTTLARKRMQVCALHSTVTLEEQNGVFLKPVPRLITKGFWENDIPEYMIPELLVAPLASIMLKVKLLDMGNPRVLLSTALAPPNLGDIVRTVLQLKEMCALSLKIDSLNNSDDGELTFLGRVLAHLPVDLHLGKMIALGHVFGCLQESLIIGRLQDERDWAKENFIQIKKIQEVAELYEDLKMRVSQFNMLVSEDPPPVDYTSIHRQKFIIQVVIAGAFYPNYFVQGELDEEQTARDLCGHDPKTTVMVRNLPPYSFLYYKQLQSLFRQCGQAHAISFDGSRAYVEFNNMGQATGVLAEVRQAMLLSCQKRPMELLTYTNDEVQARASGRAIHHMKYSRVNVDFKNNTVRPVAILSSPMDPDKLPPTQMFVVMEVGQFWGFHADEASREKQARLTTEINGHQLLPISESLYPSLLCLAPYPESPGSQYYRANIQHVRGNLVEVFFVDFGNKATVLPSSLRELPPDLASQPFQAHEFCVVGMRPSAQSLILGDQWSSGARERYMELTRGHTVIVSLYSVLHGVMRVVLYSSSRDASVNVADVMVREGHAVAAAECYDSKQNHDAVTMLYKDLADRTYVASSTSSSWKDRKVEETELIDDLLDSFKDSKAVCIEKNSINSVAVNDNPQHKHQRMLVAGVVNVNTTSSSILLRETTLMPDIPGLPALVSMLFTPVMELRINTERTCYTGALCGLGWNSSTLEPLLPERDMELTFDTHFDVEDIIEISALREAINSLLSEGPRGFKHPLGHIARLQEECRDGLVRLCAKSPARKETAPMYYEKPGQWNQVDPTLQMATVEPEEGRGKCFLLHPVILLDN
ncbi:hypothetical protein CRUP_005855 [Coryphaenoides rupestris]|nr:hypothetical protein CRUP_005855 [Coryphaenoides rupestris]